ncbi:MAG: mechanosensitive ion channel family protein, partial [Tidjanibacter sp.]|nr:mechanosensitive ion channel family protein [Tidjanibacter sp.]
GEENAGETLKRIETIMGIVHGVCRILLWVIFLLIFLAKININIGPILASAGIVGLAVGFGAQELVRDFISGFFILLEDQLRTGDMAIINGQTGVVEKIELRTITLRDGSGVVHIFQNGKINSLSNMTKEWSAIVIEMGVAYKEDVDRVMAIMQKVGDELYADAEFGQHMLQTIEINGLDQFLDSSIIIKATLKTRPMKQWIIKREYQRRLKIAFDKENVEIPYPHISIYTGEDTKPFPIDMKNNKE